MGRLWQLEISLWLPSIYDGASANEILALGMLSFPSFNQSSFWQVDFAGRMSNSLSKNETGASQKINMGNWFIWFKSMFWLSSAPVPGEEQTVFSDGALGSARSASNLGWDSEVQKMKRKKCPRKTKECFECWILLVGCQLEVLGEGMRFSTLPRSSPDHLFLPSKSVLLLVNSNLLCL